jgi:disulfide bond formation protein DsbB
MSAETINNLNIILGSGAIILQVLSALVLLLLIIVRKNNPVLEFVNRNFIVLGFLVSLGAMAFSLLYSEVINFLPCHLCWLQRIFLFPLVFIFGAALSGKDRGAWKYAFPILSVGLLISIYHNLMYYFAETSNLPCDASGVSCYQHLVSVFGGYISIPMLSLTTFFAVFVILMVAKFYKKEE